eukprot:scaffold897_cov402-Prasinococcus_capsulatus_cf.AAC.65
MAHVSLHESSSRFPRRVAPYGGVPVEGSGRPRGGGRDVASLRVFDSRGVKEWETHPGGSIRVFVHFSPLPLAHLNGR